MRCKTCQYDLANLTEHRCPECGTPFDPNDDSAVESIWPQVFIIAVRTVYSYVVMMLLYALIWFPAIQWAPERNELKSFSEVGCIMLIAAAVSNVVAANQGWFARVALLILVWLVGLFLLPAIARA